MNKDNKDNLDAIILLRECYSILEDIKDDGWIIRGGKTTSIPKLLERVRSLIHTPIPYAERVGISFQCISKDCNTRLGICREYDNHDAAWTYKNCETCNKKYRIVWGYNNVATFIVACDEEK